MIRAVYPGSFDPVTLGHLDLIERAKACCDQLIVAVIDNPNKKTLFDLQERQSILRDCLGKDSSIQVDSFSGLLVDYLQKRQATVVFRGLRDSSDASSEMQMARLNRQMLPGCDTLWLASKGDYSHISSSFVREIARLGGPIAQLVAPSVAERLKQKLSRSEAS